MHKKILTVSICAALLCGCDPETETRNSLPSYGSSFAEPESSSGSAESSSSLSPQSSESESSSVKEPPAPRENAIGKSNKVIDWFVSPKAAKVRNDKTGKWRYSVFTQGGIDISEYALKYYEDYFNSDNEIHAVINLTNKTSTRISYNYGMLFVTVHRYVDGEENDANLMFSGIVLQDFIVYTDNGDIEKIG